jgi:hypothetical protein
MSACRTFRRELELALEGRPRPEHLTALSFDVHLLACSECRDLLESEQALEALLASLPEPRLPEAMARRVLARLRRDARLDSLLEAAPEPDVPAGLAARVLAGVSEETDPLDRLLDAVPAPEVPAGLASEVLAGVRAAERRARFRPVRRIGVALLAAAAVLLVFLLLDREPPAARRETELAEAADAELSDEFLAAFDVLENWDHLGGEDLDLLLASIDEIDELVVDESLWIEAETEEGSGG